MSIEGVAGLVAAIVAAVSAAVGALWKWAGALENRAYEKARAEAILREAQDALAAKNTELTAKDREIQRLHGRIASLGATVEALAKGEHS